jgi:hypothetical protein
LPEPSTEARSSAIFLQPSALVVHKRALGQPVVQDLVPGWVVGLKDELTARTLPVFFGVLEVLLEAG